MTRVAARRPQGLAIIVLAALIFRAYIPVGFMPASGQPFLLEVCPAAAPMPILMSMPMMGHHHHHSGTTHDQFETCPFGCAPVLGPVADILGFAPPSPVVSHTASVLEFPPLRVRFERAHPPRGPPSPV